VPYSETKDFHDTQFEYRRKSEWAVSRSVCTVEIRPTGDVDISYKVPQISLAYSDPHSHVVIGSKEVSQIYWMK
jgi:hypothetical protein